MITHNNIITYTISDPDLAFIRRMAKEAELGGFSEIRSGENRKRNLSNDQVVGQLGTFVGSRHLLGDSRDYRATRWYANKNKWSGDGGSDISGANIDIKTSMVRNKSKDLLTYKLLVRPRELYDGWIYILSLVTRITQTEAEVKLIGWASNDMFGEPAKSGIFSGAHVLEAKDLNPIMPIKWWDMLPAEDKPYKKKEKEQIIAILGK